MKQQQKDNSNVLVIGLVVVLFLVAAGFVGVFLYSASKPASPAAVLPIPTDTRSPQQKAPTPAGTSVPTGAEETDGSADDVSLNPDAGTFVDPNSIAAPTRDETMVIVNSVEFDADIRISSIGLIVPATLENTEISLNGEVVGTDVVKTQEQQVTIEIPEALRADSLEIGFISAGENVAVCLLALAEDLELSGDCSW